MTLTPPLGDRSILRSIVQVFAESMIISGEITTEGKTDEEIQQEVRDALREASSASDLRFQWSIDHRQRIHRQAKLFAQAGDDEFALVLYAMWFEHSLNALIQSMALRKRLSHSDIVRVIQMSNIDDKMTVIPALLEYRKIAPNHRRVIRSISDERNAIVHYKWTFRTVEDPKPTFNSLFQGAEKAITYLKYFENRYIFGDKRSRLVPGSPGRGGSKSG